MQQTCRPATRLLLDPSHAIWSSQHQCLKSSQMDTKVHGQDGRLNETPKAHLEPEKQKTKDEIIEEKDEQIETLEEELQAKDEKIMYWYGRLQSVQKSAREVLGKPGIVNDLNRLSTEVNRLDDAEMILPVMREQSGA